MIVEDGSCLPNANSYVTVEFADQYFLERGLSQDWPVELIDKEICLIKATDYIELKYSTRFIGYKLKSRQEQSLSWPRKDAITYGRDGVIYDTDEIPLLLQKACCEYALNAYSKDLMPQPEYDESGNLVIASREKIGPIEVRYEQGGAGSYANGKYISYPVADSLMSSLLIPASNQNRCIR